MLGKNSEKNKRSFLAIFLAILSGCLFAAAAAFGKMATGVGGTSTLFAGGQWLDILSSLWFWKMVFAVIGGSILWILALKEGKVSIVGPVQSGFMILFSIIIGITLFGESVTSSKIGGIAIITLGGMLLSRKT